MQPEVVQTSRARVDWADYRARLLVFVRTFGGRAGQSPEDTTHEIIVKAIAHEERYDGTHASSTWIYRIARNHCIDVNRKGSRRSRILEHSLPGMAALTPYAPHPDQSLVHSEAASAVALAISRLSPRDRRVVFLRFYEDMSVAEIAEIMDMPAGTVKYRLHVLMKRLRRQLRPFVEDER